jgi:hypothetical protein
MKATISITHTCGHTAIYPVAWRGGAAAREKAETLARGLKGEHDVCRDCFLGDLPHVEALAIHAALAAGARLAANGVIFYRFGSGQVHVGGDVRALAVVASERVYIAEWPAGDHPYVSLADACASLGYKRSRRTSRSLRRLETLIADGRRDGWQRAREAMAQVWPGEKIATVQAQTDDGYYRRLYPWGKPQVQTAAGHRDSSDDEIPAIEAAIASARAEAANLKIEV